MAKMNLTDQISNETESPSNNQLEEVTVLAQSMLDLLGGPTEAPSREAYEKLYDFAKKNNLEPRDTLPGATLATLVQALLMKLKRIRILSEQLLPEAMASIGSGLTEFKLASGYKITIKDDLVASLKADRKGDALDWLEDEGFGDIIKDDVVVKFAKGESPEELLSYCRQHNLNSEENINVHWQTLKSLVKEQLERGKEFPPELFNVEPFKKAIIKPVK